MGVGLQRLEAALEVIAGALAAVRRGEHPLLLGPQRRLVLGRLGTVQGVVALLLHAPGVGEHHRHAGQEDRGGLAAPPGPHEAPDGLGEEERGGGGGGVDPDAQPRHVDPFGDHPDRDEPARGAGGELLDPLRGAAVVGEHDGRPLAGDLGEHAGVGAGVGLVAGDDHRPGVLDVPAHLGQPLVRGGEDRGDPLPLRVQRGAPRLGGDVLGHRLAEPGGDLVPGAGAPAHGAAVGHEEHRPDDPVAQRLGIAVGVVAGAAQDPVVAVLVADEGDRVGVRAEGGAGEGEAPGGRLEGLADGVAPGLVVAAVVDLVEDDQGALGPGAALVHRRPRGDLGVGDRHPVVVAGGDRGGVGEARVEVDADPTGRVGPLGLEVLGRGDHGHAGDLPLRQQLGGDPQGEGGLAGARGGDREEVAPVLAEVALQGLGLPGAQRPGGTPGGPPGEGGREVRGGGLAHVGVHDKRWHRPPSSPTPPGGRQS